MLKPTKHVPALPFVILIAYYVLISGLANGQTITQTFDELPIQPVDGLSFRGVTFHYELDGIASDDAKYGSFGPVATEYVSDPSVVGNSRGILTLEFDIPTSTIEFGVALSDTGPLSPGLTVEIFDDTSTSLTTIPTDTAASATATGFSDALFRYDGIAVRRMVVDFADGPGSFAFDNLVYIVPEPATGSFAFVLCILTVFRFREANYIFECRVH